MHVHRKHPWVFDGLVLQSGSFFHWGEDYPPHYDPRKTIRPFVQTVHQAPGFDEKVPIHVTCGLWEGNLANNRLTVKELRRQGYQVVYHETEGDHDWPSWQAALAPALIGSLQ